MQYINTLFFFNRHFGGNLKFFIGRAFLLLTMLFAACTPGDQSAENDGKPLIVCTTGMIGDALKNIVGDSANVVVLMGPGVDPHLYKATQGDLQKLSSADIIFYNGLHLEGKMGEILEKVGRLKPVIPVTEKLPKERLRLTDREAGIYDPHVWFDVSLWSETVRFAGEKMREFKPEQATFFLNNTEIYIQKLTDLHRECQEKMKEIPADNRVLITSHDAFGYFGGAYDTEVRGLQGISTVADIGLNDVTDLVRFITNRKIKAVFTETSVSAKSVEAVLASCREKGHNVKEGGALFSDAMGADGSPEGTYIGMVRANVRIITKALR